LTGDEDDGGFNAFVPNFYWVKTLDENMKFGLGVNTPFGLAVKYDDDWVGRYHAVESDLKTINFNPSIGYRVNDKVSIGGGVNVMLADVILSNAVDFGAICVASLGPAACAGLGALPQEEDGFVDFDADNFDDIALGFNLGVMYDISSQTRIGVAYRSEVDIEVEGEADFTVPASTAFVYSSGLFLDSDIGADVTLPASFSISVSHQKDKITYLADITWTGWSSFDELRIEYDNPAQPDSVTTEDWDDTFRYSFGIDYQYSDKMILRTGIAYDETPVPSAERRTARLPGDQRTWISFGMSYIYSKELSFDIGYSHLFVDDAEIDNTFESSVPTLAATLTGDYDASVDILSAQLNWKY
jgi:long-chain fatty acid transport protein